MEEGEIDEPYVPEFMEGVFTTEEAQVDEEDEFADEYAFHNDCLFNGIDEVISPTIQAAQDLLKRKLERVRKSLERKEREKDVILKEGPQWDEARNLFNKKELTLEKKEDRVVLDHIRELRSQYSNIHTFYEKFVDQVTSISVSAQKNGWMMYINFQDSGSKLLSTKSFKKLNIVELFVLMKKVIKGGSKVNELMRDHIEERIKDISVEAFHDPPVVKYYKPSTLHNMTLSDECLDRSHLEFIKYVEGQLRCKVNRSDQDLAVAEVLYAFRLNRAIRVSVSTLKKESRLYLKPVYAVKEDGTEELEQIADSRPYIKMKNEKAWFSFQRSRGGHAKVAIDRLKDNNSDAISRVLSMIKISTCKEDKLFLEVVDKILREKLMEESVNDTPRVQGFPKRITVFMFSKKSISGI